MDIFVSYFSPLRLTHHKNFGRKTSATNSAAEILTAGTSRMHFRGPRGRHHCGHWWHPVTPRGPRYHVIMARPVLASQYLLKLMALWSWLFQPGNGSRTSWLPSPGRAIKVLVIFGCQIVLKILKVILMIWYQLISFNATQYLSVSASWSIWWTDSDLADQRDAMDGFWWSALELNHQPYWSRPS